MTDVFRTLQTTIDNAQRAIYDYVPVSGDTVNNRTDLYNLSRQQGGENAIEALRAAAYNAMLNPSAKAAIQRGDIDIKQYFEEQFEVTVNMGLEVTARALEMETDDYQFGGAFQRASVELDTASEQLTAAKEYRKNFRAGQEGYSEAVSQLEAAKKAVRDVKLRYPSLRDIEIIIMTYLFHYLAGYGDGTNWKIKVAITDGIFDGIQSVSIKPKDMFHAGAAKNFHPVMIAEIAFGSIVEGPRNYVDEDGNIQDYELGESSHIGDPSLVEFRYNQIIKWMSLARRKNGRKEDIYIARQNIPDAVWEGYKEQVVQRYQKALRLINEGINVWDEAYYEAAKIRAEAEAQKDKEFLDAEDVKLEDLTEKQINEFEKFYNQVDDDEDLQGISEEQILRDLREYERQIKRAEKDEKEGRFSMFREEAEEASDDDDDDMGDLTQEQIDMYKRALEGTPDDPDDTNMGD